MLSSPSDFSLLNQLRRPFKRWLGLAGVPNNGDYFSIQKRGRVAKDDVTDAYNLLNKCAYGAFCKRFWLVLRQLYNHHSLSRVKRISTDW
ncbi:hypothetical protein NPIL_244411 [Nephila pilipes]|uniref:Uncharacterized protein n=1 Tax=Nephila pilipes TaxID=299642 RepID=A0A8X6NN82_NEPPI|nr:hypothetical protein NPIL_244411 [Nephila pilipes]